MEYREFFLNTLNSKDAVTIHFVFPHYNESKKHLQKVGKILPWSVKKADHLRKD